MSADCECGVSWALLIRAMARLTVTWSGSVRLSPILRARCATYGRVVSADLLLDAVAPGYGTVSDGPAAI